MARQGSLGADNVVAWVRAQTPRAMQRNWHKCCQECAGTERVPCPYWQLGSYNRLGHVVDFVAVVFEFKLCLSVGHLNWL